MSRVPRLEDKDNSGSFQGSGAWVSQASYVELLDRHDTLKEQLEAAGDVLKAVKNWFENPYTVSASFKAQVQLEKAYLSYIKENVIPE